MKNLGQRAYALMKISDKADSEENKRIYDSNRDKIINTARFSQHEAIERVIKREWIWAKSKNMINKEEKDPERISKNDLANFSRTIKDETKSKFARKREMKGNEKRK